MLVLGTLTRSRVYTVNIVGETESKHVGNCSPPPDLELKWRGRAGTPQSPYTSAAQRVKRAQLLSRANRCTLFCFYAKDKKPGLVHGDQLFNHGDTLPLTPSLKDIL